MKFYPIYLLRKHEKIMYHVCFYKHQLLKFNNSESKAVTNSYFTGLYTSKMWIAHKELETEAFSFQEKEMNTEAWTENLYTARVSQGIHNWSKHLFKWTFCHILTSTPSQVKYRCSKIVSEIYK